LSPLAEDHYVWLIWASAFLVPWLVLFAAFPHHRTTMWWASLMTAPLGLTEPIFVPAYWNPPSLFDLAQRSGFDIESALIHPKDARFRNYIGTSACARTRLEDARVSGNLSEVTGKLFEEAQVPSLDEIRARSTVLNARSR
jgi:hypothetical protein